MRLIILLFVLLPCDMFAGGKGWPGIPYSKVQVFMYNLDGKLLGNHSPVKNGAVEPSVHKPLTLNKEQDLQLRGWFTQDTRVLEGGLSSCYIPHHAIVYFDENDRPVAWMSICFMCAAIRKYVPEQKGKVTEPAYNKKSEKKAMEQLEQLKNQITGLGFPVFNSPDEYATYNNSLEKKPVKVTMINTRLTDEFFSNKISHINLEEYILNSAGEIRVKDAPKITAGGDRYYFFTSTYKNSVFEFSGIEKDVTYLDNAIVKDFEVNIAPLIRIGMSLDEFFGLIVYDGPSYPEIIEIKNEENTRSITLHFVNGNLQWYEMKN